MPLKPMVGLGGSPRRAKPKTRAQARAKSAAAIRDEKLKNLEKARKKRASNLRKAKKAAKA